jgi:hypothetical protein
MPLFADQNAALDALKAAAAPAVQAYLGGTMPPDPDL